MEQMFELNDDQFDVQNENKLLAEKNYLEYSN